VKHTVTQSNHEKLKPGLVADMTSALETEQRDPHKALSEITSHSSASETVAMVPVE